MATCPTIQEVKTLLRTNIKGLPILGEGGYGKVYKYGNFVLKVLNVKGREADFSNESKTLFRLKKFGPLRNYLPDLCWAEIFNDTGVIVQRYEKVRDLFDYLDENPTIPFDFGHALFENISKAIGALHRAGYIHRDIKPENILVRENSPVPILIDFGMICKMPCLDVEMKGSPGFIPYNWINPEEGKHVRTLMRRPNFYVIRPRANKHKHMAWINKSDPIEPIISNNTKRSRKIKTSPNVITPHYSKYSDNYALYVTLKELFAQIDWTGHEATKHKTEIYLNRLGGQMVGQLAAQYAIESGKAERPPSSKNSNNSPFPNRFTPNTRKRTRSNNNANSTTSKRPQVALFNNSNNSNL